MKIYKTQQEVEKDINNGVLAIELLKKNGYKIIKE